MSMSIPMIEVGGKSEEGKVEPYSIIALTVRMYEMDIQSSECSSREFKTRQHILLFNLYCSFIQIRGRDPHT